MQSMFSVEERHRVRDQVLEIAASDDRVIAAAMVGGLADGGGDRWSDLDLAFGVAEGEVLDAFGASLVRSMERKDLLRALDAAVAALLREATEVADVAAKVEPQLRDLTSTELL
jgi:hypothetical protein